MELLLNLGERQKNPSLDTAYDDYGNEAQVELLIEWRGNPSSTFTCYLGLF